MIRFLLPLRRSGKTRIQPMDWNEQKLLDELRRQRAAKQAPQAAPAAVMQQRQSAVSPATTIGAGRRNRSTK